MARAASTPRRSLPVRAELCVAAVVVTIVAVVELRDAIAISGVAVLTYYAITNAAALTLTGEQRRWPPVIAVVGLVGCVAADHVAAAGRDPDRHRHARGRGRRSGDHHPSNRGPQVIGADAIVSVPSRCRLPDRATRRARARRSRHPRPRPSMPP